MGKDVKIHAKTLSDYVRNVLLVEDKKLKNYNSESYQQVLSGLIKERKPWLTLMGHTSSGIDLAPRLAVLLSMPLATDC